MCYELHIFIFFLLFFVFLCLISSMFLFITNKIIKQYFNYEHTNGGAYELKTIEKIITVTKNRVGRWIFIYFYCLSSFSIDRVCCVFKVKGKIIDDCNVDFFCFHFKWKFKNTNNGKKFVIDFCLSLFFFCWNWKMK